MANVILKHCIGCNQNLADDNFSTDKRSCDGLQPRCRTCTNVMRRVRYAATIEQNKVKRQIYYAVKKDAILKTNALSRERHSEKIKQNKRTHYERIKTTPEFIAKSLAVRQKNINKKREYDRIRSAEKSAVNVKKATEWRKENPYRVRLISFTYDSKRRLQVRQGDGSATVKKWLLSQKMVCNWCGVNCKNKFHIDHVEPLSRGGLHVVSNLCVACPTCNLKKNAKDPYEFAQSLGRLF